MRPRRLFNRIIVPLTAAVILLSGCAGGNVTETHIEATYTNEVQEVSEPIANPYPALSVPTQITRIGDLYFIVDCYNNRVIYSDSPDAPLEDWYVMTTDIDKGHTVAGDGEVYLVDDTERNRVLVFEYRDSVFVNTQVFEGIGNRPHFIVYNDDDRCFYVWSSMTGEMYVFERETDSRSVYISRIMKIDELDGVYVRSFTIDSGSIYLVSGNSQIIEARISDFKIKNRYAVPDALAGMIQIMPVDGGYYITVSTDVNGNQDFATIVFAEDLADLDKPGYTDIYSYFVGGGTPYYLGEFDGRYYLTEHRLPGHSVWSFDIGADHMPADVKAVF